MNTLLSIRTNIFYAKKEDELIKHHEIIFLVDKPKYTQTNGGEIIRERAVDELRFIISDKVFDTLIEHLVKLKDIDESELD